ncbi:type II secretion system F family protein [Streptomyces sp. SCSIO ZS0520]|uniref:type II secretion system F family protein n=1 Tax=Streptomyces sp. SCSIO ZS0520 TaxID=2892996 RepID=UPI0021D8F12E|nr:type II secretion system F family protein [Streptomyces sp. SCSIO ZS0520]
MSQGGVWGAACAGACCAGGASWLATGSRTGVRRLRRLCGARTGFAPGRLLRERLTPRLRDRAGGAWWCLVAAAALALLGRSLLPLLLGGLCLPAVRHGLRASAARARRERGAEAVVALCGVFAGEVRAGRQPPGALLLAARETGGLGAARAPVIAAARFGGDVPAALRTAARQEGAEGLLGLAACWRVAVDRGAGLAAGVQRLERALREERAQRAELRAQLAGARSTAVLLAGLPVMGLLLGSALGARPLDVLLHRPAGLACLAVGVSLEAAGLWWALRIVRGAEER